MQLYQRRPAPAIQAMSWDEFIAFGLAQPGASIVNGVPWSFRIGNDQAVTHERDNLYLLSVRGRTEFVTPTTLVVFDPRDGTASTVNRSVYVPADDLQPRVAALPARSIDFRITAPHITEHCRFAVPVVAALLRRIADGLEADEDRVFDRDAPPPSGFSELAGNVVLDLHEGSAFAEHYRGVRVQWCVASNPGESEAVRPAEPETVHPDGTHRLDLSGPGGWAVDGARMSQDELLDGLTEAERRELAWTVTKTAEAWKAEHGDNTVVYPLEAAETLDDFGAECIKTLRMAGIIGQNEKITLIFGETTWTP